MFFIEIIFVYYVDNFKVIIKTNRNTISMLELFGTSTCV